MVGYRVVLLGLALVVASGGALAAEKVTEKGKSKTMGEKAFVQAVSHWLVLGPLPDALPLFHEEDKGRYGVEDLLKAERGPSPKNRPAAGDVEPWPSGGSPTWKEAPPDRGSRLVALPTVATNDGRGYATAWLTSYLTIDRFCALDVEITGTHPRRVWLDGEAMVMGGVSKDGTISEAKGSLKLEQGTHVLTLETIYDPERGTPWNIGAVLSIGKAPSSGLPVLSDGTDPTRDLTLADVLDAPQITSIAISPDGALVATGLTRIAPGSDDVETWVTVRATKDGAVVRSLRGGIAIGQLGWSPVGHKLSYLARDRREAGKESTTLWLSDLDSGETTPLLERVENLTGYRWAPDGTSVVYAVTARPEPDKRGVKLRQNLLDRQAGWRDKSFLHQVSVPGGVTRRLTAGGLTTGIADFSPDGKRLLLMREVEDVSARPFSRKELWELDLTTLYANKLHDSWWMTDASYAPDGKRMLILSGPSEFGELGRDVPAGTTPNELDGQLYLFDPTTGEASALSRGFDPSIQSAFWSRFDGMIYVKAAVKDGVALYRLDPAGRSFTILDTGGEVVQQVSFAEKAAAAACTVSGAWTPESLSAIDLHGGPARKLGAPSELASEKVRVGRVVPAVYTVQDGFVLDGRVYLPPGFDAAATGRYPAIVYYYGGTLPDARDFGGRYPKEWWADHGYLVYVPEPEGAVGYGQKHSAVHVNDWGRVSADQIIEGARAFLGAYPAVDPKRVGCIGASYGGFLTMVLLTRTDMFAAAVSHAGISNIASYWGEGVWGYSYSGAASAGSFPWNRKDLYVDHSPLFAADKVKTPLLLTHGSADTNVPPGESESFYTALTLVGAPVELLTVEGQDHHILDHAKRMVWSRSILAWFDKWLKKQPGWWDDLYPKTQVK